MPKLPIECRARYNMIVEIANELGETFINGNRKTMLAELEELEPKTALAVLAHMMANMTTSTRKDMSRFLKEMA